jgi:hypothetical protein
MALNGLVVLPFQGNSVGFIDTQGGALRLPPRRSALGWFVNAPLGRKAYVPTVVGLYLAAAKAEPMLHQEVVEAVAQKGLIGDRYFLGTGYYSHQEGWGANVTLIQSEAIAAINVGHQSDFTAAMLRRNILTAEIDLTRLLDHDFRCGNAVLRGMKPYPPCAHLAFVLGRREVLKYFAYCGGIGAQVITGGRIQIGDRIEFLE